METAMEKRKGINAVKQAESFEDVVSKENL